MQLYYFNEHNSCENYITNNISGFKHLTIKKGESISSIEKTYNYLFFVTKGKVEIVCNEYSRIVKSGEIILIPKSAESTIHILQNADIIIHSFTRLLNLCDRFALENLEKYASKIAYNFEAVKMATPFYAFLDSVAFYLENKMFCMHIQEIKQTEMLMIFRAFYSKEECTKLFYPLLSPNIDFKNMVLENFQKVKTVHELADICCLSLTTFNRKFKELFKDSPYNWILKQKAKHIQMKLKQLNIPICDIIEEYGFSSPGHFTSSRTFHLLLQNAFQHDSYTITKKIVNR